jgi:hypothetical protein
MLLYPRAQSPGTHGIGGWMGPRAGLDNTEKRIFLILLGFEIRPLGLSARSHSLYRLSYRGFKHICTRKHISFQAISMTSDETNLQFLIDCIHNVSCDLCQGLLVDVRYWNIMSGHPHIRPRTSVMYFILSSRLIHAMNIVPHQSRRTSVPIKLVPVCFNVSKGAVYKKRHMTQFADLIEEWCLLGCYAVWLL